MVNLPHSPPDSASKSSSGKITMAFSDYKEKNAQDSTVNNGLLCAVNMEL